MRTGERCVEEKRTDHRNKAARIVGKTRERYCEGSVIDRLSPWAERRTRGSDCDRQRLGLTGASFIMLTPPKGVSKPGKNKRGPSADRPDTGPRGTWQISAGNACEGVRTKT